MGIPYETATSGAAARDETVRLLRGIGAERAQRSQAPRFLWDHPMKSPIGESRHERCRYGLLTEAWRGDGAPTDWEPTVLPICAFPLPEPCPPALKRQWGGSIDVDRDCAVCPAFKEVTP